MNSTTSFATILDLRHLFSTHGLLDQIVSDNGSQFVAEEFQAFLKVSGVRHNRSVSYHPTFKWTSGAFHPDTEESTTSF